MSRASGRRLCLEDRLHPEERDGVIHVLHTQLAKGHFALPAGFRLRHRDGSYRWIHPAGETADPGPDQPQIKVTVSALRQKAETHLQAKPATLPAVTVTDPRRLQHELEVHQIELEMQNKELRAAQVRSTEHLERYTDLYDFAPVGYFTFTTDGTVRAVNLLGATLAGLERGRLVGRRFGLFVNEADRGKFSDFLKCVLTSEGKQSCEVRLAHEGTVPRDVKIDGLRSVDGQECHAVLMDVTERNQQQELLLTATRFAQATIDALAAHVCVLAQDGLILATNAAWRRFAAANPPATLAVQVGANYLTVCARAVSDGDEDVQKFLTGLQAVLTGESEQYTYE
ncbi:MAG: PAS domain S-box protein, partial [Proteobacteria bacterium]|nr:PAS domain S-box protein [Pseudomonadota bacterium]